MGRLYPDNAVILSSLRSSDRPIFAAGGGGKLLYIRLINRSSSRDSACWDWCTCRSFSVVCLTVGSKRDFIPVLRGSVAPRGGVLSSGVGETWEVGEDILFFVLWL